MAGLEELLALQEQAMNAIHRILPNFKKLGKTKWTVAVVQNRHVQLKKTFSKCEGLDAKINMLATDAHRASLNYFVANQFVKCEDNFNEASDFMAEVLNSFETHRSTTSPHTATNLVSKPTIPLPQIKLPSFDGRLTEWEAYRDQFQSLIHCNDALSACEKMHYLKSSLAGDALRVLSHLTITASNYEIAWRILISRYENKRRLITKHVSALLNLSHQTNESAAGLQIFRDTLNSSLQSLRGLDRPVDSWHDVVIVLVTSKFDVKTRRAWETRFGDAYTLPTYDDLDQFIAARIRVLEALLEDSPRGSDQSSGRALRAQRSRAFVSHCVQAKSDRRRAEPTRATAFDCLLCHEDHQLHRCSTFLSHSRTRRLEIVKQHYLCHNCLSTKHVVGKCASIYNCRICSQRHHTLLHPSAEDSSSSKTDIDSAVCNISSNQAVTHLPTSVLLATARVRVMPSQGRSLVVRALLDQGSTATLISERLAQMLHIPRRRCNLRVAGINGGESVARFTATIKLGSTVCPTPAYTAQAIILSSLTKYASNRILLPASWEHTRTIRLSDSDPGSNIPIDLIIGADLYGKVLREGILVGGDNEPTAQNTIFGWVLSGVVSAQGGTTPVSSLNVTVLEDLDAQLRRFWEVEDLPSVNDLTPSEQECEDHFTRTHSRDEVGRYIVRLPFVSDEHPELGNSFTNAMSSFQRLELRFSRKPALEQAYRDFMSEYEALGHMSPLPAFNKTATHSYYIPHHAVVKEGSVTSHLRVVFNASSASANGKCLNDSLLIGPKLQLDLASIILRWRQHKFVLTSNIEKMYRQIWIHPQDTQYQQILWRPSPTSDITGYRLRTVTYGTASAPYLALRVLRQLIADEGRDYPLAVSVLQNSTYVDDCMFGADTEDDTVRIREQLAALLGRGGFRLRKWASNEPALLLGIDPADHGLAQDRTFSPDESLRVLGIGWNPTRDIFHFQITLPTTPGSTKRTMLSTISRFYDPLGWLAPVIVSAKILVQRLWSLGYTWDEIIPSPLIDEWYAYYSELLTLRQIEIPRWTGLTAHQPYELHAFSDASSKAYAAAIYIRYSTVNGRVVTHLLTPKSRVAPLKTLTIPRLELCAAHLLTRLLRTVASELSSAPRAIYCWTDSSIVLAWLRQPSTRWKTFVANRVSRIQAETANAVWRHVSTDDNPADCASRGISPQELVKRDLWWFGPEWLRGAADVWPSSTGGEDGTPLPEERSIPIHAATYAPANWDLQHLFSSWARLLRVTALLLRFINRCRRRVLDGAASLGRVPGGAWLSKTEIMTAKRYWLRVMQEEMFAADIQSLISTGAIPTSSAISSLTPFLDSDGLLHAKGRLRHSQLSEAGRHPILLRSHPLLVLIVRQHHLMTLHGGTQLTLVSLRQEYWILRSRQVVRAILHRCVACARERARMPSELMGDLPRPRVTRGTRAFEHTGVDYAGPMAIRTVAGRGYKSHKSYIALFICLTVKAIHLELVSDCSTAAFLAAYQRFVARRGTPTALYSDNGTNFQGAAKELRRAHARAIRDHNFQNFLVTAEVQWHFLPPSAPHFGGLWEAGVKSTKYHLRRCVGKQTLTFKEMTTLLARIEACLNSRPLVSISDNLEDYTALTPGHFLIGTPLIAPPEPSVFNVAEGRLSRWQAIQHTTEHFWRAWASNYLHTLQQRPKWRQIQRLANVGRLVLLRNPSAPPCQ